MVAETFGMGEGWWLLAGSAVSGNPAAAPWSSLYTARSWGLPPLDFRRPAKVTPVCRLLCVLPERAPGVCLGNLIFYHP